MSLRFKINLRRALTNACSKTVTCTLACERFYKNNICYIDLYALCQCPDLVGWLDASPGGCFGRLRRLLGLSLMWCHEPIGATCPWHHMGCMWCHGPCITTVAGPMWCHKARGTTLARGADEQVSMCTVRCHGL